MSEASAPQPVDAHASQTTKRPALASGLLGLVLGFLALGALLLPGKLAFFVLGLLILIVGLLQNFTGFALRDPAATRLVVLARRRVDPDRPVAHGHAAS